MDNFGEIKISLGDFEEFMIDLEQDAIDLSLEHIKAQHIYLTWVAACEVFARTVMYVDNFWKIKFSLRDFRRVLDRP